MVRHKCKACGVALPEQKRGRPRETCHPDTGRNCKRVWDRTQEALREWRKLHENVSPARKGKVAYRAYAAGDLFRDLQL